MGGKSVKEKEVEVSSNSLEDIKPINTLTIDLKKYDKKEVEIEGVDVLAVPSTYTKSKFQWVLRIYSKPVETLGEGEEQISFRASELFNLVQEDNEEGKLLGFPTGEGSNLAKFTKDIGIENLTKANNLRALIQLIIGKKALIKAYDKEVEGTKRTYLKFRY